MKPLDFDRLNQLVKESPEFIPSASQPPTLMEISGYPNWENVYSNILAFFLDSEAAHKVGILFVRSLIEIYNENSGYEIKLPNATDEVDREVFTKDRKRIDILIESSDLIVCVETKVWSPLHNDLDAYYKHCKKRMKSKDVREFVGIVLTPNAVEVEHKRFRNITFRQLASKLRCNLGTYLYLSSGRYQFFLLDFIEQIEKFSEGDTMTILTEKEKIFLNYWNENPEEYNNIEELMTNLRGKLNSSAKKLQIDVMEKLKEQDNSGFFNHWTHQKNVAVFDLQGRIEGCRVFLDIRLELFEIEYKLGCREYRGSFWPQSITDEIERRANISFMPREGDRYGFQFYTTPKSTFEECSFEEAVENSVKILDTIADMYRVARN